jgi:hypothetical protein
MATPEIRFPCPVRRIQVAWRDGSWTIENEIRIDSMTLPKSDELPRSPAARGVSGFWYEAVDAQGRALYRQSMQDPFSSGMEMFEEDGSMRRKAAIPREIFFDILAPDMPELVELHFYSSTKPVGPNQEMRAEGPAERIATINLRSDKEGDHGNK